MKEFTDRFFQEPAGSFFLLGPRGTGKSTWLRHRFAGALWINLLDPKTQRRLIAKPERLREWLDGSPDLKTVVVDEVQKAPEILSVDHEIIEEKTGYRFLLTGSSARKLKRSGVDLLAGRAVVTRAHSFMASELGEAFELSRALEVGLIPLVLASEEMERTLEAYTMLYVREEVMAEGLIRDLGGFTRFLEAISFSQASQLNLSEVSRECEVSRKTVEGYLSVLEDMLLACRLPVFARRAKRELVKQQKFYFADCGVFSTLRPKGPLDRAEEIQGAALEGLVCQHLRAWCDYTKQRHSVFYWRTPAGVEVDFVLYGETYFWALEVKNSTRVERKDLKGLRAFLKDYPECQALLLYRGEERLLVDNIHVIPCTEFLRNLVPNKAPVRAHPASSS